MSMENELTSAISPMLPFLMKSSYFDKPFNEGIIDNVHVINSPDEAQKIFNETNVINIGDWEDIQNIEKRPVDLSTPGWYDKRALDFAYKYLDGKNFNGLENHVANIADNILSDMLNLMNFHFLNLPLGPIWGNIQKIYLNDGWPCGWIGGYPDGKMVVFSNK